MPTASLNQSADHTQEATFHLPLPVRLALALVAGLLLSGGYALHPLWWAPWLAPVPLIIAYPGSHKSSLLVGGVAGAAAMISVLDYYIGQSGWTATIVITLCRVATWVAAAKLTAASGRRLTLGAAMLALPATVAGFELITLIVSPHGAAGSLAYSQMDMPSLIQVAALGGVPAVVFLVLLPGSLAGLWLSRAWPRAQRLMATCALASICLAVALFTIVRLAPSVVSTVPVALISTDRFARIPQDWNAVWSTYRPAVEQSARAGALVVLPEKLALLETADAERASRTIAATAAATGATIVAGIEVHDGQTYRNRALVATRDGRIAWYDKQRLVPGWEARDTPGDTPLIIDTAGTRTGIAICKDMHVPSISREYAGAAAVMAVPAWDFGQDGWMGARMTALRAVENGYAIARSARDGLVGAYDRFGRVIVEREVAEGMTIATTMLAVDGKATLYGRFGDVIGWACVAIAAILIFLTRPAGAKGREDRSAASEHLE